MRSRLSATVRWFMAQNNLRSKEGKGDNLRGMSRWWGEICERRTITRTVRSRPRRPRRQLPDTDYWNWMKRSLGGRCSLVTMNVLARVIPREMV